jgi:hypothetical protein
MERNGDLALYNYHSRLTVKVERSQLSSAVYICDAIIVMVKDYHPLWVA